MKVVLEPRCPAHPTYDVVMQVTLASEVTQGPTTWRCSVCRRPLGVASIHDVFTQRARWPERRRCTPQAAEWSAIDWDFVAPSTSS
jgi:hypothetical protein